MSTQSPGPPGNRTPADLTTVGSASQGDRALWFGAAAQVGWQRTWTRQDQRYQSHRLVLHTPRRELLPPLPPLVVVLRQLSCSCRRVGCCGQCQVQGSWQRGTQRAAGENAGHTVGMPRVGSSHWLVATISGYSLATPLRPALLRPLLRADSSDHYCELEGLAGAKMIMVYYRFTVPGHGYITRSMAGHSHCMLSCMARLAAPRRGDQPAWPSHAAMNLALTLTDATGGSSSAP